MFIRDLGLTIKTIDTCTLTQDFEGKNLHSASKTHVSLILKSVLLTNEMTSESSDINCAGPWRARDRCSPCGDACVTAQPT